MRRILVIVTALVATMAAATAYAASTSAINTYTAALKFSPNPAGTASKPAPLGFAQIFGAAGTNGNRTAVLSDIRTTIYGLKVDSKDFPTCSESKIASAQTDAVCPKQAQLASGSITAVLGPVSNFSSSATQYPCNPDLHAWNSGPGKITFFFVDQGSNQCLSGAIKTGQVGPYSATYKNVGKNFVLDVPIPSTVDYPLGPTSLAGSLTSETLNWLKVTAKVHGKTVAAISSVGCLHGKRPYTNTFTATLPGTGTQTVTVPGSAACK